jgi:hypothetical protein
MITAPANCPLAKEIEMLHRFEFCEDEMLSKSVFCKDKLHQFPEAYEDQYAKSVPVMNLRSKSMSTAEKINARMFFIIAYVAQPTDDRLQHANKEEI